jgi:hypothetical protein
LRNERAGAIVLAAAIFVAPFIALLYRAEAGLAVMAAALVATTFLLHEALAIAEHGLRRWVRIAIGVNVVLAVACIVVLAWLLSGG